MTIKQAIFDFLRDGRPLNDYEREEARREVRELVGKNIFNSRRPDGSGPLAITLSRGGGNVLDSVSGPVECKTPVIDITIWGRDNARSTDDRDRLYNALHKLLQQFRGSLNNTTTVQTIHLEGEPFERATAPFGASDNWDYQLVCPFLVVYATQAATFATTATVVPVEPTPVTSTIELPSATAWTPDADATAISDPNAIGSHAWAVGENDNISEQITANVEAEAQEYDVYVRYRSSGLNVGAGKIKFTQASTTELTIPGLTASSLYLGAATHDSNGGYTDVGSVTLTAGDATVVIEGPTTSSDHLIIDHVALIPV